MEKEPRDTGVVKGFASLKPEHQREIARLGGASVPAGKRAFSQDRELAASAGSKGGKASVEARRRRKEEALRSQQDAPA